MTLGHGWTTLAGVMVCGPRRMDGWMGNADPQVRFRFRRDGIDLDCKLSVRRPVLSP
jgi:hypothetical protein